MHQSLRTVWVAVFTPGHAEPEKEIQADTTWVLVPVLPVMSVLCNLLLNLGPFCCPCREGTGQDLHGPFQFRPDVTRNLGCSPGVPRRVREAEGNYQKA